MAIYGVTPIISAPARGVKNQFSSPRKIASYDGMLDFWCVTAMEECWDYEIPEGYGSEPKVDATAELATFVVLVVAPKSSSTFSPSVKKAASADPAASKGGAETHTWIPTCVLPENPGMLRHGKPVKPIHAFLGYGS